MKSSRCSALSSVHTLVHGMSGAVRRLQYPHRSLAFIALLVVGLLFSPTTVLAAPIVLQQFEGLSDTDNVNLLVGRVNPPDNGLAVGPSHVFEMVNEVGRITDKAGNVLSSFSLKSFFNVDPGFSGSDPRILYDAASGRWYATFMNVSSALRSSSIILAVSSTSDPTGPFCRYRLGNPTSESFLQDYPVLGITDDKIVVSYDAFNFPTGLLQGGGFYVINKAQVMACATIQPSRFPPALGSLKPAQALSSTSTAYMVGHTTNSIAVRSINGVPGGAPVTVSDTSIPITNAWLPPPPSFQRGSSVPLEIDARTQTVVWQSNSLWLGANAGCVPPGDVERTCIRLVEIRTDSMTVRQDILYGAGGGYFFHPAARPDASGNLIVVFMESSASDFPSVRATGRLNTDPLNTLQPSILLRAGEAAETSSVDPATHETRIGDYSGAALDPVDPLTVWVSSEYIQATGDWGTSIAQLSLGPEISLTLNTHTVAPGDLVRVSVTAVNPGVAGFVDVYFAILVPPASGPSLGCPNGNAVAFLADALSKIVVTCASAPAQTFPILYQDVSIPAGLPVTVVSDFYSLVWPPGAPLGTYIFAMFFTHPGALADGVIDPADVIAVGLDSLTLQP
jgi:hypothetical protein